MSKESTITSNREFIFDFFRSVLMITVFIFHFYKSFPGNFDYAVYSNPLAELFVGLAGFMVGMIYLHRNKDSSLLKRGLKILLAFYIIALPEAALKAYAIDPSISHVLDTLLNVLIMNEDPTAINILRFYGLMFILLPIILYLYRRFRVPTLVASTVLFFGSTLVYTLSEAPIVHSFFVTQTVLLLLQWQLFFVTGLVLGHLYKVKKLHISRIKKLPLVITGALALFVQLIWFRHDITKFPYTFGKLLGMVYLAPIGIYLIYFTYSKIKGRSLDAFVRVVGRNSLVAFVLSELLRITLIKIPVEMLPIPYSELSSFVYAVFLAFVLIWIMWGYETVKTAKKAAKTNMSMSQQASYISN
ncbi:hypothetical protein SD71_14010 [Cohnella kolymensis]|uniref:Acyltransferase 3 domain-containing protein n=1 Tax=Cohnella kolymensis TaxID=1590652 RepID=A0ABR5A2X0_9BACL|nr:OpgC domain-containing protein [Cohnella kolymensis]KIL35411.1 hypothetical protein SD71_14010 [Cohnella kolymensis]